MNQVNKIDEISIVSQKTTQLSPWESFFFLLITGAINKHNQVGTTKSNESKTTGQKTKKKKNYPIQWWVADPASQIGRQNLADGRINGPYFVKGLVHFVHPPHAHAIGTTTQAAAVAAAVATSSNDMLPITILAPDCLGKPVEMSGSPIAHIIITSSHTHRTFFSFISRFSPLTHRTATATAPPHNRPWRFNDSLTHLDIYVRIYLL